MPTFSAPWLDFCEISTAISYSPTNRTRDGKFRKVKIELVAPDGSPLTVLDQRTKNKSTSSCP